MGSNDFPDKDVDYIITCTMLPQANDPLSVYAMESQQYTVERNASKSEMHRHSYYELHYILDGEIYYSFPENRCVKCSKGNWIIISPQMSHALYKIKIDTVKISCQFGVGKNEYFNGMLIGVTKDTSYITGRITDGMLDIIERQRKASKANDQISSWIMRNNLLNLVLITLDSHLCNINMQPVSVTAARKYNKLFYLALRFIKENANHRISCGEVADFLYVSQKKLNEIFHQYAGKTVSECIAEYRVEYAKSALKSDKERSIREISEQLDFCSEYYFCRFFKKHTGKTPRQYRD